MRTSPLLVAFVLPLLLALPARAQQNEEDPALPDIAPQEVEIRGELEFSFPQLERQPLIGFNPPPRVPEVPETRRPYVETYKQPAAELPGGDTSLPLAEGRAAEIHRETDVVVEAGGGRFLSRYVDASTLLAVSDVDLVGFELAYDGTDGFDPDEGTPDTLSSRDALAGALRLTSRRGGLTTTLSGTGFYRDYVLYDAQTGSGSTPRLDFPSRTARGGALALDTAWPHDGWTVQGGLRYASSLFDTEVRDDATPDNARVSEQRFQADLATRIETETVTIEADGDFATAGLDGHGFSEGDVRHGNAGAAATFPFLGRGSLKVGARLLAISTSTFSGDEETASYFAPVVELDLYPGSLHLYARQTPGIERHALNDLFEENPYLGIEPTSQDVPLDVVRVQPSIRHVDVEVGARLYGGHTRFSAYAGWQEQANQRYFMPMVDLPLDGYETGFFQVAYAKARTLSVGLEGTMFFTDRLQATASARARQATLTTPDLAVPYVSPFVGGVSVSYAFGAQRGLAQLGATLRAPAYTDLAEDEQTDLYADVDASVRYRLLSRVSIVARLRNALPGMNEWWVGYPEPPLVAQMGIRLDW